MNQQGMGPIARAAAAERMRETDAAARVRAEYEESPEYRIGCELLDGLTQELGISAEQAAALGCCLLYAQRHLFDGRRSLQQIVDALQQLIAEQGLTALWEGSSLPMA